MLIGELSRRSGLSTDAIRWYEKVGVLNKEDHERSLNNYRNYPETTLEKLRLIKQCRSLNFSIEEIKQLSIYLPNEPLDCEFNSQLIGAKIQDIEQKIQDLELLKSGLLQVLEKCEGNCAETIMTIKTG